MRYTVPHYYRKFSVQQINVKIHVVPDGRL